MLLLLLLVVLLSVAMDNLSLLHTMPPMAMLLLGSMLLTLLVLSTLPRGLLMLMPTMVPMVLVMLDMVDMVDTMALSSITKRSADADAYYGAYGLGYAGYGGYGGYYGPHAAPAVAGGVAIRGYGQPVTVAHNAPYGYAASGIYAADSVGAIHTAKRSADADAYYGGYGIYLGPETSGLSTISHAGFPLQGYAQGYGYGLYGHY